MYDLKYSHKACMVGGGFMCVHGKEMEIERRGETDKDRETERAHV